MVPVAVVALCADLISAGRQPNPTELLQLQGYPLLLRCLFWQLWSPVAMADGDHTHSATLRVEGKAPSEADLQHLYQWARHGGNLTAVYHSRNTGQAVARGRRGFASVSGTKVGHNAKWAMQYFRKLVATADAGPHGLLEVIQYDVEMPISEAGSGRQTWYYICPVYACVWLTLRAHVRGEVLAFLPPCSSIVSARTSGSNYRNMPAGSANRSALNVGGPWRSPKKAGLNVQGKRMSSLINRLHTMYCPTNCESSWQAAPARQHVVGYASADGGVLSAHNLARALVGPDLACGAVYIEQIVRMNGANWRDLPASALVYPMPVTLLMDAKAVDQVGRTKICPILATCGWLPYSGTARANLRTHGLPVAYLMLPAGQYDDTDTPNTAAARAIQPQLQILFDAITALQLGPIQHLLLAATATRQAQIVRFRPVLWSTMTDLAQQAMNAMLQTNACPTCCVTASKIKLHTAQLSCPIRADMRCGIASALTRELMGGLLQPSPLPKVGEVISYATELGLAKLTEVAIILAGGELDEHAKLIRTRPVPLLLADETPLPPTPCTVVPLACSQMAWPACDGCMWLQLAPRVSAYPSETPHTPSVNSVYSLAVSGFRAAVRTGVGRTPMQPGGCPRHGYQVFMGAFPEEAPAAANGELHAVGVDAPHPANGDEIVGSDSHSSTGYSNTEAAAAQVLEDLLSSQSSAGAVESSSQASIASIFSCCNSLHSVADGSEDGWDGSGSCTAMSDSGQSDIDDGANPAAAEVPYARLQTCALDTVAVTARPSANWPMGTLRPTDTLHEVGKGDTIADYFKTRRAVDASDHLLDCRVLHVQDARSDNGVFQGFSRNRITQRKSHSTLSHKKASEQVSLSMCTPVLLGDKLSGAAYVLAVAKSDISTQALIMTKHCQASNLQQLTLLAERQNFSTVLTLLGAPESYGQGIKAHAQEHNVLYKLAHGTGDYGCMAADEGSHGRWAAQVTKLSSFGSKQAKADCYLLFPARDIAIASTRLARLTSVQRLRRQVEFALPPHVAHLHIMAAATAAVCSFVAARAHPERSADALSIARAAAAAALEGLPGQQREFIMQQFVLPLRTINLSKACNAHSAALGSVGHPGQALQAFHNIAATVLQDLELQQLPALAPQLHVGPDVAELWDQALSPIYPGVEALGWAAATWVEKHSLDVLSLPGASLLASSAPAITAEQLILSVLAYTDGDLVACKWNHVVLINSRFQRTSGALRHGAWQSQSVHERRDLAVLLNTDGVFPHDQHAAIVLGFVQISIQPLHGHESTTMAAVVRRFQWGPQADHTEAGSLWWKLQLPVSDPILGPGLNPVYSIIPLQRVMRRAVLLPNFQVFEQAHQLLHGSDPTAIPPLSISEDVYAHPIMAPPLSAWVLIGMPPAGGVLTARNQSKLQRLPALCS